MNQKSPSLFQAGQAVPNGEVSTYLGKGVSNGYVKEEHGWDNWLQLHNTDTEEILFNPT